MAKGNGIQSPQEFGSPSTSVDENSGTISITERSDGGDNDGIDPATLSGPENGSASEPGKRDGQKRRGRPKGWKRADADRTEKTNAPLDIASLNTLVYNGHILLAKIAKIPELELDAEEAQKLSDAAANVARHYNISVSQKTLDWSNFVTAMSSIYGTRIFVIANRKRTEKVTPEKQETKVSPAPTQTPSPSSSIFSERPVTPDNPYAAARASIRPVGNA